AAVGGHVQSPPVARAPRPKTAPGISQNPTAAKLIGRRILVVDDSEMTAKLIEGELSQKGYEVATAENVDKATRIILRRQTRPDLILLDVNMPGVNGEQFC